MMMDEGVGSKMNLFRFFGGLNICIFCVTKDMCAMLMNEGSGVDFEKKSIPNLTYL